MARMLTYPDTRLIRARETLNIPRPNGRDMHSFFNLFNNYKQVTEEFFEHCTSPISDLLTLNAQQDSLIYTLLDKLACLSPTIKVF